MFQQILKVSLGLLLVWHCTASAGADENEVRPEQSERISTLILQLGSAVFEERESAAVELRKIGSAAIPQLSKALNHKSVEIRSRAAAILRPQLRTPLQEAIQKFADLPDEKLDLEVGMWLIARILNPQVEQATLSRQLDDLA